MDFLVSAMFLNDDSVTLRRIQGSARAWVHNFKDVLDDPLIVLNGRKTGLKNRLLSCLVGEPILWDMDEYLSCCPDVLLRPEFHAREIRTFIKLFEDVERRLTPFGDRFNPYQIILAKAMKHVFRERTTEPQRVLELVQKKLQRLRGQQAASTK
jgi:hypothetical protein